VNWRAQRDEMEARSQRWSERTALAELSLTHTIDKGLIRAKGKEGLTAHQADALQYLIDDHDYRKDDDADE